MPSNTDFAVGNSENECLFAQPGTGQCMVFRSSQPPIWQTADTSVALKKLLAAAEALNALDQLISSSKWTAIGQSLGASRDLREAVGFLTAQVPGSDGAAAAAQAKKVFKALEGVQLAAQKKDGKTAKLYFDKYEKEMPVLIKQLS